MSEKLLSEINIKTPLKLICFDESINKISIQKQFSDYFIGNADEDQKILETDINCDKLPDINDELEFPTQDNLVKKLNDEYLIPSSQLFEKIENIPTKTDLEEFKKKKREDSSIVGFNKIKFDKINDQIKALNQNATLEVLKDSFNEYIEVNQPVHVIANPTASVNCNTKNDTITCNSYDVIFENFTFNYRGNDGFSAARISKGNATFINCKFSSSSSCSVKIENTSRATFINCEFSDSFQSHILADNNALITLIKCKISNAKKNGIELKGDSAANVVDCDIVYSGENGVSISSNSSALFEKCKINTNKLNGFEINSKSKNIILRSNEISQHAGEMREDSCLGGFGISVYKSDIKLISNIINDNGQGAIISEKSTVTTSDNKFYNTEPSPDTCLVNIKAASKFVSKSDIYEGGVKYAIDIRGNSSEFNGDDITIKNNNYSSGNGIIVCAQSKLNIKNSRFEDIQYVCVSTPQYSDPKESNITIQNCTFSVNNTEIINEERSIPIAIQFNDKTNATIEDCTFSKFQKAITLINNFGEVLFQNCVIQNSYAHSITASSTCNATFKNCCTQNNEIVPKINLSISGKIPASEKCLNFINCSFKKSSAQNVSISQNATVEFNGCSFEESTLQSVEVASSSTVALNNCSVRYNRHYGLVVTKESTLNVNDSFIHSNNGNGFVCEGQGSTINLENSYIYSHTKASGGVIKNFAKAFISGCEFYRNIMNNISILQSGEAKVKNSKLHSSGGSVASVFVSYSGILNIESSDIYNETTSIYIRHNGSASLTKCNIYDCQQGGIMLGQKGDLASNEDSSKSSLALKECHLYHNNPYGVVYMLGKLDIENCIFENNFTAGIGKYEDIMNFTIDPSKGNKFTGNEPLKIIRK